MRDQTADLGRDDDLVLAGLDPPGLQQLFGDPGDLFDFLAELVEDLRALAAGNGVIAELDLSVLRGDHKDHAFGVDVALAHVALRRQEHLGHMGGLRPQAAVDRMPAEFDAVRRQRREAVDQRAEIAVLRQPTRFHLLAEHAGLVRQDGSIVNGASGLFQQGELLAQRAARLGGGQLGMCGVKEIEGVLAVQAAAADADDAAALGHHRRVVDRLGALRDHGGEAHGIRGQHADVIEVLAEQLHELFQARSDRVEVGGENCFHDQTSFPWILRLSIYHARAAFSTAQKPCLSAEDACVFPGYRV